MACQYRDCQDQETECVASEGSLTVGLFCQTHQSYVQAYANKLQAAEEEFHRIYGELLDAAQREDASPDRTVSSMKATKKSPPVRQ